MLSSKRFVLCVVFVGISLSNTLFAADMRLLVVSIRLPPPNAVTEALGVDHQAAAQNKINGWGGLGPQKFAKKMIKGFVVSDVIPKTTSGIMGVYGGYCGYSDREGCLTFPLRHTEPHVDVIVTPSIDLDRLYQQTYSGIFISQKTMNDTGASSMQPQHYKYMLQQSTATTGGAASQSNDKDSKGGSGETPAGSSDTWVVTKSGAALDTRLPANAVIVLVNPANIFVAAGSFPTNGKQHLILPDMYLIGKKFNDAVLLNNQKNMKYFEEITIATGSSNQKGVPIQQSVVVND